jgi:hypothetical protein
VEYRIHQSKLGRSDMEDEIERGRPPPDDVDARILACLSHEPVSSVRSVAQTIRLAPATVHRHVTESLGMQSWPFRPVSTCWRAS